MDSKQFIGKLETATGSKTKTKRMLINCYKDTVRDKFAIKNIGNNIQRFIKWLKTKDIDTTNIVKQIKEVLNNKKLSSDQINNQIDSILINNNVSMEIRVEYNVLVLLNWMKKDDPVKKLFKGVSLNKLDSKFKKEFGNDFTYYQNRFINHEKRKIDRQYRQWANPEFTIIDKYKGVMPTKRGPGVREIRRNVRIVGGTDRLRQADIIAQGGLDSSLKSDFDNLRLVGETFSNEQQLQEINDVWKNQVYKYLRKNNLKPRTPNRNSLYVLLVYLMTKDKSIDEIIKATREKGLEMKDLKYATSTFTTMVGKGYATNFKKKLNKLINPHLNTSKLVNYLNYKKVPKDEVKQIMKEDNNKLQEIQEISRLTERKRTDITWKVLKSNKVGKITRKLVNSIYE